MISTYREVSKMETIDYIENEYERPYDFLSMEDKEETDGKYNIVHDPSKIENVVGDVSNNQHVHDSFEKQNNDYILQNSIFNVRKSPEYLQKQQLLRETIGNIFSSLFYLIFIVSVALKLDGFGFDLNWWITFIPYWMMVCVQFSRPFYNICFRGSKTNDQISDESDISYTDIRLDGIDEFSPTFEEASECIDLDQTSHEEQSFENNDQTLKEDLLLCICFFPLYVAAICILIVKLEDGKGSFSSFWVISPLLIPLGIIFIILLLMNNEAITKVLSYFNESSSAVETSEAGIGDSRTSFLVNPEKSPASAVSLSRSMRFSQTEFQRVSSSFLFTSYKN